MLNALSIRQRKAIRELWLNKPRSLLVITAIAIGIFAVGLILSAYAILTREMDANFLSTNPPSAILTVDNLDRAAVENVRGFSFVTAAEARRTVYARIQVGEDEWRNINLLVIDNFDRLQVSTFSPERGAIKPQTGEILIERSSRPLIDGDINMGDIAVIRTPNGREVDLSITGITFDPAQPPGWMEGVAYGYISLDTLRLFDIPPTFDELHLVFDPTANYAFLANDSENQNLASAMRLLHGGPSPQNTLNSHLAQSDDFLDETIIRRTAFSLQTWLTDLGYKVSNVYIPPPGEHPNSNQMQTLLFLLQAFGGLALVLSGLLVATMIGAVLSQQIPQIGVMKAIGGRTRQIAAIYLMIVLTLGAIALLIGIPLGVIAGQAFAENVAEIMNLNITNARIPYWVFMIQILTGLLIPLLATALPIYRTSRMSVLVAMSNYGEREHSLGGRLIERLSTRLQGLDRTWLLALRSTFRRQGRLTMTVLTLSMGGAAFMVALNIAESWSNTIETAFDQQNNDLSVNFAEAYTSDKIESAISGIATITYWEGWGADTATIVYDDHTNSNEFTFLAPPADTKMADFQVSEGRWLQPDDTNSIVLNHTLLNNESELAVGDTITLTVNDQQREFTIVGIVEEVGVPPIAYLNYPFFAKWTGTEGTVQQAQLTLNHHDEATQKSTAKQLEAAFDIANLHVKTIRLSAATRQVLLDHIVVLLSVLLMMAALVVAVGGLGLASAMSLNVLERTREIGVIRAIGASDIAVFKIILIEGLFIGLLSWGIGVVLSLPLTNLVGNVAGQVFIRSNLYIVYSPLGIGAWLLLVIIISSAASAFPALRSTELPVHEVLAYE